jgi:hypothetical protein
MVQNPLKIQEKNSKKNLKTARQVMGSPIISTDKEGGPSIFKRHMKTRSSRVNNAHETRLKHVEYEGNTKGIRV